MRSYPPESLRNFAPHWLWIVSDRIGEFDAFLRRPLRSMKNVRARTIHYLEIKRDIPDEASASIGINAFRAMLDELAAEGEDVDRIFDWCALLTDIGPAGRGRLARLGIWKDTFVRWTLGRRDAAKYLEEDVLARLIASYKKEVFQPSQAFNQRWRLSELEWLKNPKRRTQWDEILWIEFFQEIYIDPAMYPEYLSMLTREWWRRILPTFSKEAIKNLTSEYIDNIQNFDDPQTIDWGLVCPIDEAIDLAVPAFDEVAAPRSPAQFP